MRLPFTKVEGLGNDFILFDARHEPRWIRPEVAAELCNRRRGVGADGVLTLLPPDAGQAAFMHIYNADGTEPEMCGNGLRCAILSLEPAPLPEPGILVGTPAGPRRGRVTSPGWVRADLGRAEVGRTIEGVEDEAGVGQEVLVGNPHLVLWGASDPMERAQRHGQELEHHEAFPNRVNVGFARWREPDGIELVVYERGSGITRACGTGAAAAATAAVASGRAKADQRVEVDLPGGTCHLEVASEAEGYRVWLEGPARAVFEGNVDIDGQLRGASQRE